MRWRWPRLERESQGGVREAHAAQGQCINKPKKDIHLQEIFHACVLAVLDSVLLLLSFLVVLVLRYHDIMGMVRDDAGVLRTSPQHVAMI